MKYIFLILSIILEVMGTSALKYSKGFSEFFPSLIASISYVLCFYFLSLTLKVIPIGIAYAIWAGVGILLMVFIGMIFFNQIPDIPAIIGMIMIIIGILIMNLVSKTISH